jgi:hypothetical protein
LRKDVSDRGHARDVQLHHRQRRVQLAIHERALQSMAGVVDQDVDRNASLLEAPMQVDDGCNIREIDLLHHDVDAVLSA